MGNEKQHGVDPSPYRHLPSMRTITLAIAEPDHFPPEDIKGAATILKHASTRYSEAGYEVQTIRLSTRPIFDDLADWSFTTLINYAQELQRVLDDVGVGFCSVGTAQAARLDFPLERIELIADLLAQTSALNATVQIATPESGIREEAALSAAWVIRRLAYETVEGFGNFRFAMLACVAPGSPFFPSAYHAGPTSISLGLQGAGIVAEALLAQKNGGTTPIELQKMSEVVRAMLIERALPIVALGQALASEHELSFAGIDLSPAPMGEDSIVSALQLSGYGPIASSGPVAVAAALTTALTNTGLPTCGYCGLMLPVLDDAVLGRRWEEGVVPTHHHLLYSAVCGKGLDSLPLPGNPSADAISHLPPTLATPPLP